MAKGMFGLNANPLTSFTVDALIKNNMFIVLFCVIASTPVFKKMFLMIKESMGKTAVGHLVFNTFEYVVMPCGLLLISTAALVGASYNPFLYFRF